MNSLLFLLIPLFAHALALDNVKIKDIYTKAKAGEAQAQYELALQYLDTRGPQLKKNEKEAYSWLLKAANKGHLKAQSKLGELYEVGKGVEQDTNQAVRWYKKAADGGDAQAKRALEFLPYDESAIDQSPLAEAERLYKAGEYKYAIVEFERLAKEGNPQAQYMYGRMLLNAQGTVRDYDTALEWTKKAADQGNVKAQYSMGLYYKNGWGVEKDNTQAADWFSKAAANGDPDAISALKGVVVAPRNVTNAMVDPNAVAAAKAAAAKAAAEAAAAAKALEPPKPTRRKAVPAPAPPTP